MIDKRGKDYPLLFHTMGGRVGTLKALCINAALML